MSANVIGDFDILISFCLFKGFMLYSISYLVWNNWFVNVVGIFKFLATFRHVELLNNILPN